MAKLNNLPRDVYNLMVNREVDPSTTLEEQAKAFGEECEQIMLSVMEPQKDRSGSLRLSAIGKPARQQYMGYHGVPGEEIEGATYIKFLYGHLIEAMVVSLAKMSGHTVERQQEVVHCGPVKGHIDGFVDGTLVDIKSASSKGFKKFEKNELHLDDAFGYIGQLKAYAHALEQDKFGWIALDKTTGRLCVLEYDTKDKDAPYADTINYDIVKHVDTIVKTVEGDTPPPRCYEDEPAGKSGNRKLAVGCAFCPYKHTCWDNLREFKYSNYTEYLTHVSKTPRVEEIPSGF